MLKGFFNKKIESFDEVQEMTTRPLPVPGMADMGKKVTFTAQKKKDGYWVVSGYHNARTVTSGVDTVNAIFRAALVKHIGKSIGEIKKDTVINFDTAFLILRDIEEAWLKSDNAPITPEPEKHYMTAYRLAGLEMKTQLDAVFFERTSQKGEIPRPFSPKIKAPGGLKPSAGS